MSLCVEATGRILRWLLNVYPLKHSTISLAHARCSWVVICSGIDYAGVLLQQFMSCFYIVYFSEEHRHTLSVYLTSQNYM